MLVATQKPSFNLAFEQTLEHAAWRIIPSWYLVAQGDQAIRPELQRFFAQRIGAQTTEIQASHLPFLSHPEEVATLIEAVATAASEATRF